MCWYNILESLLCSKTLKSEASQSEEKAGAGQPKKKTKRDTKKISEDMADFTKLEDIGKWTRHNIFTVYCM
jgi:hypothetical protein